MSDIEFECDIRIIIRATGLFSFWDRHMDARLRILAPYLTIFNLKTSEIILSIDLSKDSYTVNKLNDYKDGISLQKGNQNELVEFQVPDHQNLLDAIKSIARAPFFSKPRNMPTSTEILSSLARNKTYSSVELSASIFGLRPWNIQKSASIISTISTHNESTKKSIEHVATLFIVIKRAMRKRRKMIEESAATLIQCAYRSYLARKRYLAIIHAIIRLQAQIRAHQARKLRKSMAIQKKIHKLQLHRSSVVQEIYTTELSYVQQLENVQKIFIKPLKALDKKAGVTSEQISVLFSNIEEIYEKHVVFLETLTPLAQNFNQETVLADAFLKMANQLGVYIPYCNNFEDAKAMLQKCQKIEKFSNFLATVDSAKALNKQDLNSFLILPVQRIPRYELLLKDLIRHTWPDHPDYKNLELALAKIHEAAKNVNRAKSFNESRHRLASLQIHIAGSSSKLGGSFKNLASNNSLTSINVGPSSPTDLEELYIGEGALSYVEVEKKHISKVSNVTDIDTILSGSDPDLSLQDVQYYEYRPVGQLIQVYAYLFQNTIVLTKRAKGDTQKPKTKTVRNLTIKQTHLLNISLERAAVGIYQQNTDQSSGSLSRKDAEAAFMVTTADGRMYKFVTDTHELKKKWIQDINEALDQLEKNRSNEASDINDFLSIERANTTDNSATANIVIVSDYSASSDQLSGDANSGGMLPRSSNSSKSDVSKLSRSPMLLRKLFKSHEVLEKSPQLPKKSKTATTNSQNFLTPPKL